MSDSLQCKVYIETEKQPDRWIARLDKLGRFWSSLSEESAIRLACEGWCWQFNEMCEFQGIDQVEQRLQALGLAVERPEGRIADNLNAHSYYWLDGDIMTVTVRYDDKLEMQL